MQIIGNEENVNMITLRHRGISIKLRHHYMAPYDMTQDDLERNKEVEIIFNDLIEVDSMIFILERFKKECGECIGEWGR